MHIECVYYSLSNKWGWEIYYIIHEDCNDSVNDDKVYNSYEDALDAALLFALNKLN